MRTLFSDDILAPGLLELSNEEAHHARSVLRLATGDEVRLTDGRGGSAEARITELGRHQLRCEVGPVERCEPGPLAQLTVAVAPPKGSRFEDLVRMLTELGVGTIRPLACERSIRQPALERAQRVSREALKQCRRAWLPVIGPVLEFPTLIAAPAGRIICCDAGGGPAQAGAVTPTTICIGPEGGFTELEREQLLAAGAETVRLARPILRIETAAVAAAAIWAQAWEHDG